MPTALLRAALLAAWLAFCPTAALAQGPFSDADLARQRHVNATLDGLCNDVNDKTLTKDNPEEYTYVYERKFYAAAGVNFTSDSLTSATAKLQALWDGNPALFFCSSTNFSVPAGDLLKYAIETRSFGLVENAMTAWHLDLNRVDPADCRTLLDFVQTKLAQNRGTHLEPILTGYATRLRQFGAKYSSEISSTDKQRQAARWQVSAARLRATGITVPEWRQKCS
jgi:hypothetical protein